MKYAHSQLFLQISFELFLVVNVDKIALGITVKVDTCRAKLKKKCLLKLAVFDYFSLKNEVFYGMSGIELLNKS